MVSNCECELRNKPKDEITGEYLLYRLVPHGFYGVIASILLHKSL